MIRLMFAVMVMFSMLGGCTTERVGGAVDAERAAEANTQLGIGYMQQGRYDVAMKKFEKALDHDPKNALAHHYKAELHRRLKQYDQAKDHYEKALDYAPKDSLLLNNYGVFLCEIKDYKGAQEHFSKALTDPLYTSKDQAYENMGLCSLNQGELLKAEQSLRLALQHNPKLPKALFGLAQINYDKREIKAAYGYYSRFLPLSQQTAASLWLGYLLEKERGNHSVAYSYATSLKVKFPDAKETELLRKLESGKGN
jgi:type IV pilus assembly protein PilF